MCIELLLYAYQSSLEEVEENINHQSWQSLPSACEDLEDVATLIKQLPLSAMPSQDMEDKLCELSTKQRRLMRKLSAHMDGVQNDLEDVNQVLLRIQHRTNQQANQFA